MTLTRPNKEVLMKVVASITLALCCHAFGKTTCNPKTITVGSNDFDFTKIQEAIDVAENGDTIVVHPGIYTSEHSAYVINLLGKEITLRSTEPSNPDVVAKTILSGEYSRLVIACVSGESNKTIINGLTITKGASITLRGLDEHTKWGEETSAGMFNRKSSPQVLNCVFVNNKGDRNGGAIYNFESAPLFSNCVFSKNSSELGGGICNVGVGGKSKCYIKNCLFTKNSSQRGGGVYVRGCETDFSGCTFIENNSKWGGGIYISNHSSTLSKCIFTLNTCTGEGGALYLSSGNSNVLLCLFENNNAERRGGGVQNYSGKPTFTRCLFNNNTAKNGDGGGAVFVGKPALFRCEFNNNTAKNGDGGGLHLQQGKCTNCVFNNNSAGRKGGGVCIEGSYKDHSFVACTFTGNKAKLGGGIYSRGDSLFAECTLSENTASKQGGGLCLGKEAEAILVDLVFCANSPNDIEGEFKDNGGITSTIDCP